MKKVRRPAFIAFNSGNPGNTTKDRLIFMTEAEAETEPGMPGMANPRAGCAEHTFNIHRVV